MKNIINQLFEIEKKTAEHDFDALDRNMKRIYHELEELGYKIINPMGTAYDERDASIEASILNPKSTKITKVLKPVIYKMENDSYTLLQKGIVIVE